VGAAIPAALIVIYKRLRGVEGMGWGDVKYLGAIGAVCGLMGCLTVLVLAAVAGAAVGILLIVAGRGSRETELPFGTFLAAAALAWLYLPSSWLAWIPW
jgi:leader peptidase (prepilin peptidase)/N-methyltransferase